MNETLAKRIAGGAAAVVGLIGFILSRPAAIASEATKSDKVIFALFLIALIIGVVLIAVSFVKQHRKTDVRMLAMTALMAALCYIGFAFFKIDIPVGTGTTAFHLGNVFCVLGALLLGGVWGGMAGAVGMSLGDLFTNYQTSAPKTFLLKLCIGLIAGFVAHRVLHVREEKDPKALAWKTVLSTVAGMLFNIVADPLVGYFYKRYVFGLSQDLAKALAKIGALTTAVNAVVAVIVATIFYLALRRAGIEKLLQKQ